MTVDISSLPTFLIFSAVTCEFDNLFKDFSTMFRKKQRLASELDY